ncbi:TorA maturation chaperone TorD [Cricetibacter osteomyelitidis]|uniref:Probable Tat proofreading chaperone DmsD n=1 Tax=Cricetibacter osteomyelitidis TaxID=1521931 RepID=A0A4V2T0V5_9PAST|nr:Tat proofreading chaperone DmsD [Cricetibacter osteomyelitidis]TCP91153.1 TorA maturation chaperone TorD [Cricetibacter osteomyelitidis]
MQQELINWISTSGRLLGVLFYCDPKDEKVWSILDFFQQPDWTESWSELKNSEKITALLTQTDNLAEQYQALFIGPNALPAPPWGSVYLDRESVIFGDSLLKLRDFMYQHNIEFQRTQDEPEDHIGLMLMLSAYIAENHPDLLAEFLSQHFLLWSVRYLQLLREQELSPFYQGVALLTQQTLQYWQDQALLIVPKVQFFR